MCIYIYIYIYIYTYGPLPSLVPRRAAGAGGTGCQEEEHLRGFSFFQTILSLLLLLLYYHYYHQISLNYHYINNIIIIIIVSLFTRVRGFLVFGFRGFEAFQVFAARGYMYIYIYIYICILIPSINAF